MKLGLHIPETTWQAERERRGWLGTLRAEVVEAGEI